MVGHVWESIDWLFMSFTHKEKSWGRELLSRHTCCSTRHFFVQNERPYGGVVIENICSAHMVIGQCECHAYLKVFFEDRRGFDSGTDTKFDLLRPGFEHANLCKRSTTKSNDSVTLNDMKAGYFLVNLNAFTDFWKRFTLMQNFSMKNYNVRW